MEEQLELHQGQFTKEYSYYESRFRIVGTEAASWVIYPIVPPGVALRCGYSVLVAMRLCMHMRQPVHSLRLTEPVPSTVASFALSDRRAFGAKDIHELSRCQGGFMLLFVGDDIV